jgi:hypothetical protein
MVNGPVPAAGSIDRNLKGAVGAQNLLGRQSQALLRQPLEALQKFGLIPTASQTPKPGDMSGFMNAPTQFGQQLLQVAPSFVGMVPKSQGGNFESAAQGQMRQGLPRTPSDIQAALAGIRPGDGRQTAVFSGSPTSAPPTAAMGGDPSLRPGSFPAPRTTSFLPDFTGIEGILQNLPNTPEGMQTAMSLQELMTMWAQLQPVLQTLGFGQGASTGIASPGGP